MPYPVKISDIAARSIGYVNQWHIQTSFQSLQPLVSSPLISREELPKLQRSGVIQSLEDITDR